MDIKCASAGAAVGLLLLAGCSTAPPNRSVGVEEFQPTSEAAPAAEPDPPKEDTIWRGRGGSGGDRAHDITLVVARGDEYTVEGRNGCIRTYSDEYGWPFFTPFVEWQNCGGSTGTGSRRITGRKGALWPLELGNSAVYEVSASSDWHCNVVDFVRVATEAGMFNTYKIICDAGAITDTFYYAPEVEHFVRWVRKTETEWSGGVGATDWQLISIRNP